MDRTSHGTTATCNLSKEISLCRSTLVSATTARSRRRRRLLLQFTKHPLDIKAPIHRSSKCDSAVPYHLTRRRRCLPQPSRKLSMITIQSTPTRRPTTAALTRIRALLLRRRHRRLPRIFRTRRIKTAAPLLAPPPPPNRNGKASTALRSEATLLLQATSTT